MNAIRHVMLIDDDEDDHEVFLSVVKNILPELICSTATNGRDGLLKLSEQKLRPDLIFLDLNMPLMNGEQFLTEINKDVQLRSIPVIILTTSSDGATIRQAIALGAKDFITKPDKFVIWEETFKKILTRSPSIHHYERC
jgi:CheY-like chemotaxis protein